MSKTSLRFNINNCVRVRLNDQGRQIHRDNHERYATPKYPYQPPSEDADGWSKWQLWSLMSEFGSHISLGRMPPFETEIEIMAEGDEP